MAQWSCIVRLPPLLVVAAVVAAVVKITAADVDRISFYFADFEENLQDLSLLGDAKFVRIEGQVDGMAVQLSGTRENTVGRLLYSNPIRMLDAASASSFATQFCFSMATNAGDGLAFIVAPDRTTLGASGPWLGLVDGANQTRSEHTFAVEFDSVMNEELLDPNSNHVGVDIETILSTATANASDVSLVLNDGTRKCAWVEYDAAKSELQVRIAADPSDPVLGLGLGPPSRPERPLMTHRIELAPIWKPWMYVGFSSSTGYASQKHKLFSWKFASGPSNCMQQLLEQEQGIVLLRSTKNDEQQQQQLRQGIRWNEQARAMRLVHSMPADPTISPDSDSDSDPGSDSDSGSGKRFRFDAGVLILLLVGFTCGACIVLFLLVGWALMLRRSSDAATASMGYEELS